jgi:hypothetical protein
VIISGFAFKTYMAYNNLSSPAVQACQILIDLLLTTMLVSLVVGWFPNGITVQKCLE